MADDRKTIAFFPEATPGALLNAVGIAQAVRELGHRAVFLSDPGFDSLLRGYGFETYRVNLSEPRAPEDMARHWIDLAGRHLPDFTQPPVDQVGSYIRARWAATVESVEWAERDLPEVLQKAQPDLICIDSPVLFPSIKRHGVPWVRLFSRPENEIEDPDIPPYLSGCAADDVEGCDGFRARFHEMIGPLHARFNELLQSKGEEPYDLGRFSETSPWLNLIFCPEPFRLQRRHPLDPARFRYLEGCLRQEEPYDPPPFIANRDKPLLYLACGSGPGAADDAWLRRIVESLGRLPYRALVAAGAGAIGYDEATIPPNVQVVTWVPQISLLPHVDAVIHQGGTSTAIECLLFAKPQLVMPFGWDGHDTAARVRESGLGLSLPCYDWTDETLDAALKRLLTDREMRAALDHRAALMQTSDGGRKAAALLDRLVRGEAMPAG